MTPILKQFKQILITAALLPVAVVATAQVKPKSIAKATKPIAVKHISSQLRDFYHLAADAGVRFYFPDGFKETSILNNEDFSFDYAMETPGHEFEVWFEVKSQKRNFQSYLLSKNDPVKRTDNPDSAYLSMGHAQATSLKDDQDLLVRNISQDVLNKFNANAGKSYLLTLPDREDTRHYKYALIISLEKNFTGTIIAVCFTNDENPEFFKNVNRMSNYIKFK